MKRTILLLVGFFFVWQFGFAQKAVITGTIISKEDGLPIIGASVVEKGTTNGTVTNFDGVYTISVSPDATLVFSYVGMEKAERKVSGTATLNLQLVSNAISIDEVVVTAMGVKSEKKKLNFAVQSLNSDELMNGQSANFVNSLQGKIAGVSVTNSGGSANAGSQIIIRSISSINPSQNNEPLFIVDGMQVSGGANKAADINPNDIENMTVLKGAAASALYGQEAANGVIMITTKSGKEGSIKVNLNASLQVDNAVRIPEIQNLYGPGAAGFYKEQTGGGWGPLIQN
ncbi:MAG: TonB-dependent receptor plug domain-containing protein, partial [Paludibacter sp.]|nr:TonB-dependent receptor plug domain-containing protein [Paludibacter sp.]